MKQTILLALLALAFPLAAFADNVDFSNMGGTLTGSSAGLSLSGSVLSGVVAATPTLQPAPRPAYGRL